ncbi:MAG: hypothetical protein GWP18_06705, partial [Proteobacteria bacterium]|nr:hypothetical protein [Pseudomonadota bacterium]
MAESIRPGKLDAIDFLQIDELLSGEERLMRDTVRQFVTDRVLPDVGDWFDEGRFPRDLIKEMGDMGLLGMHLSGYGCAGTSAVAYGLACTELEAGDSGVRSFVSVQGSLAMYPIWAFGSEEQKLQWLPGMAAGDTIGCFGLTEPDSGSDPGSMRTTARRDGDDWVLNGTKMWITNGSIADVAIIWATTDEGVCVIEEQVRHRGDHKGSALVNPHVEAVDPERSGSGLVCAQLHRQRWIGDVVEDKTTERTRVVRVARLVGHDRQVAGEPIVVDSPRPHRLRAGAGITSGGGGLPV